jgi:hypothetical protein
MKKPTIQQDFELSESASLIFLDLAIAGKVVNHFFVGCKAIEHVAVGELTQLGLVEAVTDPLDGREYKLTDDGVIMWQNVIGCLNGMVNIHIRRIRDRQSAEEFYKKPKKSKK